MPDSPLGDGRTAVLGERQLVIGFRLVGVKDTFEVTEATAVSEFDRVMRSGEFSLVIASQAIRAKLPEALRLLADSSLKPLVVFVPTPTGDFEVESVSSLAKRVLGISLAVPA